MIEKNENLLLSELRQMKQRMDSLYSESLREESESEIMPVDEDELEPWQPFFDVWEGPGEWVITADLPGVHDRDLQVEILKDNLTITGKRKVLRPGDSSRAVQLERPSGDFSRTFVLPGDAEIEEVKADLKNGVLTITVPKSLGRKCAHQKVEVRSE